MRNLWASALVLAFLFQGCSDPTNRTVGPDGFQPGDGDGDGDFQPDSGIDNPPPPTDGGTGPVGCQPKTCEELGKNCGPVADGCGDVVDCGACPTGESCGLLEHNECAKLEDLCVPVSMTDACAGKECGKTADGCGNILDCGSCGADELCGLDAPFTCGTLPVSNPDTCTAQITTCASVGKDCGQIGNGCGNLIDCDAETGGCTGTDVCGLGGPEQCGALPTCTPLTPAVACAGKCGIVSNGCEPVGADDGLIDCEAEGLGCTVSGQTCGGAGTPNQCGSGGGTCQALTKAAACGAATCGKAGDGCGGSHDCGNLAGACPSGDICRNGTCEALCTPILQATACAGKNCGQVGDGCGGSYECGVCGANQTCGLFTAFVCGNNPPPTCQPLTTQQACSGKECGIVFDGCGTDASHQINCGTCPSGEYCGIDAAFQCDGPPPPNCTPATSCAQLGWACGIAVDSCGNTFNCALEGRSCNPTTETCIGGINGPTTCQMGTGGGTGDCDVCDSIPNCSGQPQVTKLTGRVITPGKTNGNTANQVGIPNAFVYIMRNNIPGELPTIGAGIPNSGAGTACDRCDDQDLGPVLVSATTDSHGNFELSGDIPVGEQFVLVTKIGKWRRAAQITVAAGNACATSSVATTNTRLPRAMNDGLGANIPRIAVSTGRVDAMECVFQKLGVANAEFAQPNANATNAERVHMYRSDDANGDGDAAGGASMSTGSTADSTLYGTLARMSAYDMVVFDCEAATYNESAAAHQNVREYVNRGGRMFASHFSYSWIANSGGVAYSAATFQNTRLNTSSNAGSGDANSDLGYVSIGRSGANAAKIPTFSSWLINEGAATQSGTNVTFTITDPRDLAASVNPPAEEFVYRFPSGPGSCGTCTALNQTNCVNNSGQCTWNGSACVVKTPMSMSCSGFNFGQCIGQAGCSWTPLFGPCTGTYGGTPNCGGGTTQATCQASNGCGWTPSTNTSVQQYAFNTPYGAPAADICGRVAYSGFHVAGSGTFNNSVFPAHCDAGNSGNLTAQEKVLLYMLFDLASCVTTGGPPEPPNCSASDEATLCAGKCGDVPDGCGDTVSCGDCPAGQVCGANNTCGPATCVETNCAAQGATCGVVADGCGGSENCMPCPSGQVCGLVTPNQCAQTCTPIAQNVACAGKCGFVSDGCGSVYDCPDCGGGQVCINNMCTNGSCTKLNMCPSGLDCGLIGDGCDGVLDCGDCDLPEICGAGGQANVCGSVDCSPLDCAALGADCGWIGDGCGGSANCGVCDPGQACGVGGPNKCGGCEPKTCTDLGAECGMVGNGCGAAIDCGVCTNGEICGAVQANKCDMGPACEPQSCGDVSAECGLIGDGCGEVVDCGMCPPGQVCSIESPNQCDPPPACPALSCDDQGAECGSIGDGCGGLLNCGPCPSGSACGIVSPNKCSSVG